MITIETVIYRRACIRRGRRRRAGAQIAHHVDVSEGVPVLEQRVARLRDEREAPVLVQHEFSSWSHPRSLQMLSIS
jgi:hypothetical protein